MLDYRAMGEGGRVERRLVHVLFADLVGFTGLAESLDAEDVALLQDRYFERVGAAVEAGGGQVEKYIGDAVVAIFGLPTVRADDARRAVETGLAIVASLGEVERELGVAAGTLRVRVGVHTGEVVVTWGGPTGSWRLSGDVVNTAARLQAAAEPGTVVVGPDTALAVAPHLALADLGPLELRGRADPVTAWRALGPAEGTPARPDPELPFAGRERELAVLAAVHRELTGSRLVLLLAPPGVGRTRLVGELGVRWRAAGVEVWSTTVRPGRDGYAPVADLFRQALGEGPDEAAVLARLGRHGHVGPRATVSARHAVALLEGRLPSDGLDPADLWTSWTAVLDACAAPDAPAPVWIVDDLHLAGPDLRAFLDHAVAHPHRASRLVVVTARPGRADDRPAAATVTGLDPLPAEVVRGLAEAGLGGAHHDPALIEEIVRAAGGNPLFVAELVRARRLGGATTTGAPARVPSTVAAIYLGQLDDLPPASRAVLETGSVAGTTLPARALPRLGVPEAAGTLRELTGAGLLVGPHDDVLDALSYTYRHVLLRDAAYGTLPRVRRASLHLRYADWLDDGRAGRVPEQVGLHLAAAWEQAPALGGPVDGVVTRDDLAARAAERLGEAGEARLATEPHRAAELFSRALELGDADPSPRRAHRLLRAAHAWRRAGRLSQAMEAFAGVADAGGPEAYRESAAAAIGFEDALFDSRLPREAWPRAAVLLDDALARTPCEEGALGARLLAARARGRLYGGEVVAGEAQAREALALAHHAGDDGAVAYALLALRAALGEPARLDERLRTDEQMLVAAVRAGDPEREFEARRLCFVDRLEAGEVAPAEAMRVAAEGLALTLGHGGHLWYPTMWRAAVALFRGGLDDAAALVEEFRREAQRWHYRDADQVHAVQLLTLHHDRGTPELAVLATAAVAARSAPRTRLHLGVALVRAGRAEEAREHLDAMRPDGFAALGYDGARTFLLAEAAEIADAVGDAAAGAELHALLAPAHDHLVVVGSGALCLGAVAHFRGLAARAAGDRASAARHLGEAADRNEAAGAVRGAARSRAERARTAT